MGRWSGLGTTVVVVGAGIVLAWLAWTQHPELRPALTPAVLLLAVAVVPGAARSAALLLVLPFLAVVFALLAEPVVGARAGAPDGRPTAVPLTALALAAGVGLLGGRERRAGAADRPGRLGGQRARARTPCIRADPLDRAELSAGGVPAERLRDLGEPARPGELLMVTDRPATGAADAPAPRCVAIATLATVPRGVRRRPDGGRARPPRSNRRRWWPSRRRAPGSATALARNPSLELQPAAAAALQAGLVDPRVVLVLADLASPRRLAVDDFPVEPLEPPYALRRHVLLSAVDGLPASGDPQPLMRTWFAASRARSSRTRSRSGASALLIGYPGSHPDGTDRRLTPRRSRCAPPAPPSPQYWLALVGPASVAAPAVAVAAPAADAPGLPAAGPPVPGHADGRRLRRLRGRPVAVVRRAGVGYGAVSQYQPLPPDSYVISMRPAGADAATPPVISATVDARSGAAYTVAGTGKSADLGLSVLNDKLDIPPTGKASVRVINAALSVPSADVGPVNGPVWAKGVQFGTETDYVDCPLGKWDLAVSSGPGRRRRCR